MFTKYDQLGRVVYTGLQVDSRTRTVLQNTIDTNATNPQNNENRSTSPFAGSGLAVYYTNIAFPVVTTTTKVLSVNYYDSYPASGVVVFDNILGQTPGPALLTSAYISHGNTVRSLKGLPTASFVNNIETNGWTRNYTFYDVTARPFATYSFNYLGGYTKTESELDFTGTPQKTFTFHKRLAADTEVMVKEVFEYNYYTNALEKHYHQVNNQSPELLTQNTYNEIGQITNKKVGNNIQSIDYTYNIRGWLTGINNPKQLNGKLFGFTINYQLPLEITNTSPYSSNPGLTVIPKYNGNISEVTWASGTTPNPLQKKYGYVYDKTNRMLAGFYYSGSQYLYNSENYEILNYDENGNITNLKRTSLVSGTSTNLIDNLEYEYKHGNNNSNQLSVLRDDAQNPSGYEGGGNHLRYDDNGNMTNMLDKGIQNISYNFLNLPKLMEIIPDDITETSLQYLYRADGIKLKKINTTSQGGITGITTTTGTQEYLDGFQYHHSQRVGGDSEGEIGLNKMEVAMEEEAFTAVAKAVPADPGGPATHPPAELQFFPTAEGFYDYIENKYIYQYKDHLGNTRVSYSWDTTTNSIDVQDENDYYPFGMNHLDPNSGSFFGTGSFKKYKYNGKELQETGMYDFGARHYMSDIGRWGVIDAYGEKYTDNSGYNYALNNPIYYIDPDGNKLIIYIDGRSYNYTYKGERDYENIENQQGMFLANTYRALDALYAASNITIDGEKVNILEKIISDPRELSIVEACSDCMSIFSRGVNAPDIKERRGNFVNLGTIKFNPKRGVLFDDVNDYTESVLKKQLEDGKLGKNSKINSPTSILGHELGHAYGYSKSPFDYMARRNDLSTQKESPYFTNGEEKNATIISTQINMNLKENPRNNYNGTAVETINVLSPKIKK